MTDSNEEITREEAISQLKAAHYKAVVASFVHGEKSLQFLDARSDAHEAKGVAFKLGVGMAALTKLEAEATQLAHDNPRVKRVIERGDDVVRLAGGKPDTSFTR